MNSSFLLVILYLLEGDGSSINASFVNVESRSASQEKATVLHDILSSSKDVTLLESSCFKSKLSFSSFNHQYEDTLYFNYRMTLAADEAVITSSETKIACIIEQEMAALEGIESYCVKSTQHMK
ncbi:MAG: hypothetical protein COA90_06090 [Gammaproteobacteria bacterium]|nr:MAG: hypothetical protein COA90_06090 [Gammaproteobacteria bacterium]